MKNYTIKITPLSPFLTPLESDTLFGHICWAMEYLGCFGESKDLPSFLSQFDREPPLIMSGAFPVGFLPFPFLPPFTHEEKSDLEEKFKGKSKGDSFDFIQWLKTLSRQNYIAVETFKRYRHGFSKYDLYAAVLEGELSEFRFSKPDLSLSPGDESQTVEVYHNAINRISGTVQEGMLFSTDVTFYKKDAALDVYLKTDYFTAEELNEIFGFIGMNGFGADKSTGSGRYEFEIYESHPFDNIEDFNSFLLLSNTHPGVLQAHSSYYTTQTKFGKLGGAFSTTSKYSPFKNPVILLNPGSVILSKDSSEYFGENFSGIHPQLPEVRHYGIGYPVKMRLKNEV